MVRRIAVWNRLKTKRCTNRMRAVAHVSLSGIMTLPTSQTWFTLVCPSHLCHAFSFLFFKLPFTFPTHSNGIKLMFTSPLVFLIAFILCLVVVLFKLLSLHKYLLLPGRLGSGLGCCPNSDIMQMIIISALWYPSVVLFSCSCFWTELRHKAGGAGMWIELPESLWVLWRCQKRIGRWEFTCSEATRRQVEGRSCIVSNQWETYSNQGLTSWLCGVCVLASHQCPVIMDCNNSLSGLSWGPSLCLFSRLLFNSLWWKCSCAWLSNTAPKYGF